MRDKIRLVSSAGTGYCYYTRKNKRTTPDKLKFKKYDPIVRRHVLFKVRTDSSTTPNAALLPASPFHSRITPCLRAERRSA